MTEERFKDFIQGKKLRTIDEISEDMKKRKKSEKKSQTQFEKEEI